MIRIGIVGCGRILAAHLRGYQILREAGVNDFRITALCARKVEDASMYVQREAGPTQRPPVGKGDGDPLAIGDRYLSDFQETDDVRIFTDYREMMTAAPIDAVNDFTTHALHHQVAEAALNAGHHLLTQKPLAVSIAAGRRMCELADKLGLVLGVFENARFRSDTRQLSWLFQTPNWGQLKMVVMNNIGNWWAPDRIVAETPWRHVREDGGGLTLDIGVHLFNHLRAVAGEIKTVSAKTSIQELLRTTRDASGKIIETIECDADDTLVASFETERQVLGSLTASWSGHGEPIVSGSGRGTCYFGSKGSVIGDEICWDGERRQSLQQLYRDECDAETMKQHAPLGLEDQFAINQHDWLEAIRNETTPETSGWEGLRDLAAAFAVLESSETGQRIQVDEVFNGKIRQYQRCIDEKYGLVGAEGI